MLNPGKYNITRSIGLMLIIIFLANGFAMGDTIGTLHNVHGPDQALLRQFAKLCAKMNDIRGNYTLGGIINMTDKAEPAAKNAPVDFLFCKNGDEFYYRLGNTVTINERNVYLYIDRQRQIIMISPQKQVVFNNALSQFGNIGAKIQEEHYQLSSTVSGNDQTISLINEHHITCKQYSISFDKRDMKIKRLHLRLTNTLNPLKTGNEKIVDVAISRWDEKDDLEAYLTVNKVIRNINGEWHAVGEFKGYQLIKM